MEKTLPNPESETVVLDTEKIKREAIEVAVEYVHANNSRTEKFCDYIKLEASMSSKYVYCNKCGQYCKDNDSLKNHMETSARCKQESTNYLGIDKYDNSNNTEDRSLLKMSAVETESCELDEIKSHSSMSSDGSITESLDIDNSKVVPPSVFTNVQSNSSNKRHMCQFCNKSFNYKHHLVMHIRIHTGEQPYSCDVCKQSFSRQSNLKAHSKIHTKEKPFSCNVCKKSFPLKYSLIKHERIHTGEKPYSCDVCTKRFTQIQHLDTHKRVHTGKKPFSCDLCDKSFAQNCSLIAHKRSHTGSRPYSCDLCNKNYAEKTKLTRHRKTHTEK